LNHEGIEQAHEAGSILKKLIYDPLSAKMVSSSLKRAIGTAKEIERVTGISISVQEDGIKESYYGDYRLILNNSEIPSDAETKKEFQKRVLKSLCKLFIEYDQAKPLIIISHQKVFEYITELLFQRTERLSYGKIGNFMFKSK